MEPMIILTMCKLEKKGIKLKNFFILLKKNRNYDEDFEDEDDGIGGPAIEQPTNKRMGLGGGVGNAVSPPQRLGSNKNDIDERWKD